MNDFQKMLENILHSLNGCDCKIFSNASNFEKILCYLYQAKNKERNNSSAFVKEKKETYF